MKTQSRVLEKSELKPGKEYLLRELPLGVLFTTRNSTSQMETVTHPPILSKTLRGCKRDCWNLDKKKMELLEYGAIVKVQDIRLN